MKTIAWFDELRLGDVGSAGGKGANLGELTGAGFPVPKGFVVTADAYLESIEAAGARPRLRELAAYTDPDSPAALSAAAAEARGLIRDIPFPSALTEAVTKAYQEFGDDVRVAVRSSGTTEDAGDRSFAGMNATFTNVSGIDELLSRIRACWISLFGDRVVAYRAQDGMVDEPVIAVIVQQMVDSEISGVMFSVDPTAGRDQLVIEAVCGLGEAIVSGMVEPDTYVVGRDKLEIRSIRVGRQRRMIRRDAQGRDETVDLDDRLVGARSLDDAQVVELARLCLVVEQHYGRPQDMEWAMAEGRTWLVQSRPITTLGRSPDPTAVTDLLGPGRPLVRGLAASRGAASGPVRVLTDPDQRDELQPGEVLVAPMTSPDWMPAIRRAAALVTDGGGMTCHAAIVSRELGVPCVVGTRQATTILRDGELVTVDGAQGLVLAGAKADPDPAVHGHPGAPAAAGVAPIATRLYVNLAVAERAVEIAAGPADGVGLLRAEFMVADALEGVHPRRLIQRGEQARFVDKLAENLLVITRAFDPRPVVYRSIDFRSNEFAHLKGGEVEPHEENPMIGYRGCYRYLREPDLFRLELDVLGQVRAETPNLRLMLPFVRTGWELEACMKLVRDHPTAADIGVWVMAEVPSVVYWIPTYARLGVEGVSIGSNDLTQLMLGVDRDSEICAELFDEADPAVIDTIERIIAACRTAGITSSLCGQAPSNRPDFADHLVRAGITSLSVNPDAFDAVRRAVSVSEWRVVFESARDSAGEHFIERASVGRPERGARDWQPTHSHHELRSPEVVEDLPPQHASDRVHLDQSGLR
ncbi:MAG: phosphoenolpyruvate synthase [Nocardioides sp.]